MKDIFKTFLLTGIPFGITMGIFWGIMSNFSVGMVAGISQGFLFGFLMSFFIAKKTKKFKKESSAIAGNKNIIMEGGANHLMGREYVGGWLILTKEEIIFKSHNHNIQIHQTVIPLNEIVEVKTSLTLGLVPNSLQIITNCEVDKFVVNKRKDWIQKINEVISMEG